MTIMITITTIMRNNKDSKSNNSNTSNNDNNKCFSNDNSNRNYDWSYVFLIQVFLKRAFYNYE